MTTANLMNVPSVKGNVPTQMDASKKLQEENVEVAEIFAGFMNQTMDISNSMVDDTSSNMDVSKTDSTQSWSDSYERYSYKEKQIDTAKEPSIEEKLDESGEVLEQAEDEVIDTLCKEFGVDEETLQNLLDDMGLSALDLLNPQNLVSFIVQLTGVASGEELLLDENFLSVMETLKSLTEGLMKELNVDMNDLQELVAEMELVQTNTEVPTDFQKVLNNTFENAENFQTTVETAENATTAGETTSDVQVSEQKVEVAEENVEHRVEVVEENVEQKVVTEEQEPQETTEEQNVVDKTATEDAVEVVEEQSEDTSEIKVEKQVTDAEDTTVEHQMTEESFSRNTEQNSEGNRFLNQNANENLVTTQTTMNLSQSVEAPQMTQFSSYLSADTVQIMEQIVQQMRVTISNEITTMEMQMNPENLGKVYVNISSEEGVVNAQFHATNEVVKEALEAQVATLRESLNQAGVKVDAIEVTIASHEFERNLEQQSKNPEENVNAQEANTTKRRNISLESLDELSGMMTEEEALVAQIMRDNGNSVDFTA